MEVPHPLLQDIGDQPKNVVPRVACLQNEIAPETCLNRYEKRLEKREKDPKNDPKRDEKYYAPLRPLQNISPAL